MGKEVAKTNKKCVGNLAIKKLSKKEQKEFFKCVRYSFLSHEDLINLTSNPIFSGVAKDYIIEGMSARLNTNENAVKKEFVINTEPRSNHQMKKPEAPKAAAPP